MTDENDKAKAFFILHDPDVVEKKVIDVIGRLFNNSTGNEHARQNAHHFLYTLIIADADQNHPVMNRVMNELFHSGRLRMGDSDFIDSLKQLIRGVVREEMAQTMNHIEHRIEDLKRSEYNSRYNKFLR